MEKRLTTTAMLVSVGFIFMLVCAVAAFFYGVQIGSEKIEAKYANAIGEESAAAGNANAYQQQDLVSFYHTVFMPYREFQNEWFASLNKLKQQQTMDAAATFRELSRLADRKADEAGAFDMQKSPLLGDAQVGYIRSLKYFKDAMSAAAESAKSLQYAELGQAIAKEKNYQAAVTESLGAQKAYYNAMQRWAASINPDMQATYETPDLLNTHTWSELPLLIKNIVIVDYLAGRNELNHFYPHDLTSRVDDFIDSGQAAKMKLHTLSAIVDLLLNTDAVSAGYYANNKARFYQSEMLPQLPFFFPDPN